MIVSKFGGTSVGLAPQVKTIAEITKVNISKQPIIVVSAISGATDLLIALASNKNKKAILSSLKKIHTDLINNLFSAQDSKDVFDYLTSQLHQVESIVTNKDMNKATLDKLMSYGEIISSHIVSAYLNTVGINSIQVIATDLIVTNSNFGKAEFHVEPTRKKIKKNLLPHIKAGLVPVVTGFIGKSKDGQTTTLGRGGSDYTASIIGYCLNVEEIQIWTDVSGIYTADPKMVKNAKPLTSVSFKEASELAAFGAKVLHPRAIKPAIKGGIPVRVLNTLAPKYPGTLITEKPDTKNPITAISYKKKITLVNIYSTEMLASVGYLTKIFSIFSKHGVSIDLVSVSEVSISLTVDSDDQLDAVIKDLQKFTSVSTKKDLAMISLIGEGIAASESVNKIFDVLKKEKIKIKMISLGATDINVSIVIQYDQLEKAVKKLHNSLLVKKSVHKK